MVIRMLKIVKSSLGINLLSIAFFFRQCQPLLNDSTLPPFYHLSSLRIDNITISSEEITSLIRSLNKRKAYCPTQHHHICWYYVTKLLHSTPQINIRLLHKKCDKHLVNNYRPISLLPICGKLSENIVVNQH